MSRCISWCETEKNLVKYILYFVSFYNQTLVLLFYFFIFTSRSKKKKIHAAIIPEVVNSFILRPWRQHWELPLHSISDVIPPYFTHCSRTICISGEIVTDLSRFGIPSGFIAFIARGVQSVLTAQFVNHNSNCSF